MINIADVQSIKEIAQELGQTPEVADFNKAVKALQDMIKDVLDKARNAQATVNANRVKKEAKAAEPVVPIKEKVTTIKE